MAASYKRRATLRRADSHLNAPMNLADLSGLSAKMALRSAQRCDHHSG
jgi:hypothetical protein